MIKALFVDFYGTVVHEDGAVIKVITQMIKDTGDGSDTSDIGSFWWNDFQTMFFNSFGDVFETQRELERKSLDHTIERFCSSADAIKLSDMMFEHWMKPPIFEEAKEFFRKSPVPIYIVSNIDTSDIMCAIEYHGLNPAGVFTSEDARSYKPRRELFELAFSKTGLKPDEVIHIGDSISSDVKGASALGIKTLWLNRFGKAVPDDVTDIKDLLGALDIDVIQN